MKLLNTKSMIMILFFLCPDFKFPNEPVKNIRSKHQPNKDYLNSSAGFE